MLILSGTRYFRLTAFFNCELTTNSFCFFLIFSFFFLELFEFQHFVEVAVAYSYSVLVLRCDNMVIVSKRERYVRDGAGRIRNENKNGGVVFSLNFNCRDWWEHCFRQKNGGTRTTKNLIFFLHKETSRCG